MAKRLMLKRVPLKKTTWTDEQEDIWSAMARHNGHLLVDAKAGTGKSTTMIEGLKRDKNAVLHQRSRAIVVFGKANAKELQQKVPAGVVSGTLHSIMFSVLRREVHIPTVDVRRSKALIQELWPSYRFPKGGQYCLGKLTELAKNTGITLREINNPSGMLREILIRYGISSRMPESELIDKANQLLRKSADLDSVSSTGIDFDDMLWLSYVHQFKPRRFDDLIIDEAQDLTPVQQYNALSIGEQITVVGDPWQSIMGFRGGDTNSMETLEERLGEMRKYPLTICWRCPRAVIQLAQKLVPTIRANPTAEEGEVLEVPPDNIAEDVQPGDMIICRTNAPLIPLVFRLWSRGTRAYIQGRQFGKDLLDIVISEEVYGMTLESLVARLRDRAAREESRLAKIIDSEGSIAFLHDKYDVLFNLAIGATCGGTAGVAELKERLEFLFTDVEQSDKVRLSSIHRAKGLEADNVFIIEPHLLPHPMARQPWEVQQDLHLIYVAVTRAKKRLIIGGSLPRPLIDQPESDWQDD